LPVRAIGAAVVVLVLAVMLLDATWRDESAPRTVAGREVFDPEQFGRENFAPRVVPELEKRAVELTELVPALEEDADAAGERYGVRAGSSPYSFAVRAEGVAGKPDGSLVPIKVEGVPEDVTVSLQIGPAINGSSLRDAVGLYDFNDFLNQVDYARAGTALNNEVKATVLKDFDRDAVEGKTVSFLGAFTFLAPNVITITPAQLEVGA
jgi:predicted lipoprotein